ncbi:hypothetical protein [Ochrobactrum sp. AN78]|uniref:hypothetical protein n=1 Tax=Ochrobactrum sp. AN78 TaxID=3039853 RepID=UPI002989B9D0|nr:hypothetical protein [Ochrobactrum sp. AN78]MDH7793543.1 endogenous inhibitor of DNA gyrase (YacG/DUF329 family) [Ochrobactrum sp. AN78]
MRKLKRQKSRFSLTSHAVVSGSWTTLDQELDQLADVHIAPAHPCPTCSKALRRIKGSNGFFWGCSDRDCKTTLPDVNGKPGERKPPRPLSGFSCTACGKPLTRMRGMSKPKQKGNNPVHTIFIAVADFQSARPASIPGWTARPLSVTAKHLRSEHRN